MIRSAGEAICDEQAFYAVVEIGEEIRSISDAHRFLEQLSSHYGVDNLAYLGVNVPRPNENRPVFVISTYATEWVERYRSAITSASIRCCPNR
jgi:Autoinducer binding domain